jgi:hypothetical protein
VRTEPHREKLIASTARKTRLKKLQEPEKTNYSKIRTHKEVMQMKE